MELVEILEISERDSKFQTKTNMRMTWLDSRVDIYNLKDDANLNTLPANERNSIWVPELTFNNTKDNMQTINDKKSIASTTKIGNYTKSGLDFLDNVYIFKVRILMFPKHANIIFLKGTQNPISIERNYDVHWVCNYDVRW